MRQDTIQWGSTEDITDPVIEAGVRSNNNPHLDTSFGFVDWIATLRRVVPSLRDPHAVMCVSAHSLPKGGDSWTTLARQISNQQPQRKPTHRYLAQASSNHSTVLLLLRNRSEIYPDYVSIVRNCAVICLSSVTSLGGEQ